MTTKKMIAFILALAMTLCFAGCSKSTVATPAPSSMVATPTPSNTMEAPTTTSPTQAPATEPQSEMKVEGFTEDWRDHERVVPQEEFDWYLAARNSSYKPQSDPFTWSNGALTVALSVPEGGGIIRGLKVRLTDDSDRWIIWGNTADRWFLAYESHMAMSAMTAQWLWNVMAETETATTLAEVDALSLETKHLPFFMNEPSDPETSPNEPDTPSAPTQSKMVVDGYPEEWRTQTSGQGWKDQMLWVSWREFNGLIADRSSNYEPSDFHWQWSNGVITVAAVYLQKGNAFQHDPYMVMVWLDKDPTGEIIKWSLGYEYFTVKESEVLMSSGMAMVLWNVMAESDSATTLAEMKALENKVLGYGPREGRWDADMNLL